jgi:large subunit ribosomal protein L3
MHVITVDDKEKTPNFGKPLYNSATVLATPPIYIMGFRAYQKNVTTLEAMTEVYAKDLPKDLEKKVRIKPKPAEAVIEWIKEKIDKVARLTAITYVAPQEAGMAQKKPIIFETEVAGGDIKSQLEYLRGILGKEVRISDIFKPGSYVDLTAVTKGKGFEGPVTRFGVKRKQAKSRKSVRAVGVISPWHPATVMYTVARAGQHGFHKRVEYNKRIIAINTAKEAPITPKGGFLHFGAIDGEYMILRGSVPGPARRLVRLRLPVRPPRSKIQPMKILQMSIPK